MIGILCEKPSALKNFSNALGGRRGSFNGEEFEIVCSVGHIYEFDEPHNLVPQNMSDYYKTWNLKNLPWDESLFTWKRVSKEKTSEVKNKIKEVLAKCDEIAIATDNDPTGEGELLAWEILDELKLLNKPKYTRLFFEDEAPLSIRKAFITRKPIKSMDDDGDYKKALYRAKWDYLSMQFTRAASCLSGTVLRQGRLKSAIVMIVGDGLDAVNNYKKIPYYQWRFKDENGVIYTDDKEEKKESINELALGKYKVSSVVIDKTEERQSAPPKLLDLAGLSSSLASKGIKAKEVLSVYQKMYESQVVSYPRTEDKFISEEQFKEMLPLVNKIAKVVNIDSGLLTHRTARKTHVKNGGSHGANRPGSNVPNSLDELSKYGPCAKEIYSLLARNFLAMFAEDYIYTHQEGHIEDYPSFKGSSNSPVSLGYRQIYTDEVKEEGESETLLGKEASPIKYEGFPKKPPVPTAKWLMKQLEKYSVGTGATRTSTFAEMSNEKSATALLIENKGKISFTEAGRKSYLILPNTHIGDICTTENIYDEMEKVGNKEIDGDVFLKNMKTLVLEDIETMKKNLPSLEKEFPRKERKIVKGLFIPENKEITFSKIWGGYEFSEDEINSLLEGNDIVIVFKKDGKEYPLKGKLEYQNYKGKNFWGFKRTIEEKPLPDDKAEGIYVPKKINIRFKKIFSGHEFTDDEIEELLKGNEISFPAISKSGSEYNAIGKLKLQTYNGHKFWGFALKKNKNKSRRSNE